MLSPWRSSVKAAVGKSVLTCLIERREPAKCTFHNISCSVRREALKTFTGTTSLPPLSSCCSRLSCWCWISHVKANSVEKRRNWQTETSTHSHLLLWFLRLAAGFWPRALHLSREEQFTRWALCFLAENWVLCFFPSFSLSLCWDKGI